MENLILPSEVQLYFDWKDNPNTEVSMCAIPLFEGNADIENIIKNGVKADRTAYPFPDGRIADNALTYVPGNFGNFKALIRIQTAGLPSSLSKLIIVFSAKGASGDAVIVKQIGNISVWAAIPSGRMDFYGTERLNDGSLSGSALDSIHSVPIELVHQDGKWVLTPVSEGNDKYRHVLEQCGFSFPKQNNVPPIGASSVSESTQHPYSSPHIEETMPEQAWQAEQPRQPELPRQSRTNESIQPNATLTQLIRGQRIKINSSVKQVQAMVEVEATFTPDISAFILDGQPRPKATGEKLVFYNQPIGAGGAIKYDIENNSLSYDLSMIPDGIERIAVVVSVDEPNMHFGLARRLAVKFISSETSYIFVPDLIGMKCSAVEMCEIYRKDGGWRFNAKGVGVNGGLAELCSLYGIEVE